jgi:hypothetical protein
MVSREEHAFPTRHLVNGEAHHDRTEVESFAVEPRLDATKLLRYVKGIDEFPRPMDPSEIERLRDPFAELLLKRGTFPMSLRAVLVVFDAFNDDPLGLSDQESYLVAEGGQIRWTPETASLNRGFRFAVTRERGGEFQVLISASTSLDSESDHHFLQVVGWDSDNRVYHYYERRMGAWIWAGNSRHALEPPTRGNGPFDSHVNGSLVMKELKLPWTHWHSMSASIQEDVLAPDDPLRTELLFTGKKGAEDFEKRVVKSGITRWNEARLDGSVADDGTVSGVPLLMRQVLETTTINLVSSDQESHLVQEDSQLRLPTSFFFDRDALLNRIDLDPQIDPIGVEGRLYLESLERYDFALVDDWGTLWQKGDTFFAFLVPEPAFEDLDVLSQLLGRNILTARFATCLLMVDFPNPVFSTRRQHLMRYVPDQVRLTGEGSDLPSAMVEAIETADPSPPPGSPEREFLDNWSVPEAEWKATFERRIEQYFQALAAKANTEEGFDGFVRLADSRRREFRARPLAEFGLTLPTTNIPKDEPFLQMTEDGTVVSTPRRTT